VDNIALYAHATPPQRQVQVLLYQDESGVHDDSLFSLLWYYFLPAL
jgi:hypothetical protein